VIFLLLSSEYLPERTLSQDYEIIVVGAGPAGATLAYELASRGINTLILEKARLPRYKCCAGGLTVKAANLLGIDIDEFVENKISGALVSFASESPFIGSYSNTIMYTVRRDKFDYALVKRAEAAGAHLLHGVEAKRVQLNNTGVEVSTTSGDFRARFVAGADGARSIVSSATGIKMSPRHVIGIQTEVRVDEKELLKRKPQITVDLGRIHGGYAWVFPKTDHLSIGVACLANKARDLKQRYQEFLDSLNLGQYSITKFNGGILPVCTGKAVVAKGRGVLLGDAAGLADPLTGEGIYHAILSARLVAPVLE